MTEQAAWVFVPATAYDEAPDAFNISGWPKHWPHRDRTTTTTTTTTKEQNR